MFSFVRRTGCFHSCPIAASTLASSLIEKFETTFAIGDKVMQIENDYDKEVYNGDIG